MEVDVGCRLGRADWVLACVEIRKVNHYHQGPLYHLHVPQKMYWNDDQKPQVQE